MHCASLMGTLQEPLSKHPLIQERIIVHLEHFFMIQLMKSARKMAPFESRNVKNLPLIREHISPSLIRKYKDTYENADSECR